MRNPKDDDKQVERIGWDRREFGKVLVTAAGGLTLGTVGSAQESKPPALGTQLGDPPPIEVDVVIVGAGLSGLIAARELKRKNLSVIVLEARDRVGGRMYGETVEITNGDGGVEKGYVDFGGQWVGKTQDEMKRLAQELDIELFDSYEKGRSIQSYKRPGAEKADRTVFDGNLSDVLEGDCQPPNSFPAEYRKKCEEPAPFPDCDENSAEADVWNGLLDISQRVPKKSPWTTKAKDLNPDSPWWTKGAKELDKKTFQDYLNEMGARDYTEWLPTMQARIGGSGGFEPDKVSLLHMAWTQIVGPQSETPELLLMKGGAGQIPELLRSKLGNSVLTGAPVTDIKFDEDGGVIITVPRPFVPPLASKWTFKARAVIVAIPPPMRKKINFPPELPKSYAGFMDGAPMGSMSKVHAIYETAFWRKDCLSGSAAGNLKTCEFIADSSSESGEPGILTSFIAAQRNDNLRNATEDAVQDLVIEDYVYYFGTDARTKLKKFYHFNWNKQAWTGGAFTSYMPPNIWTSYGEEGWRKPFRTIFWAGTETADYWPGYFDGAIRAGKRAADEVKKELNVA
ncbi:MAG: FAD-dependent oxidoreductase [Pirellulaceae bacterium]|nr:FAD-dependent oxidoreductase [Pirellulaceae bacterium]